MPPSVVSGEPHSSSQSDAATERISSRSRSRSAAGDPTRSAATGSRSHRTAGWAAVAGSPASRGSAPGGPPRRPRQTRSRASTAPTPSSQRGRGRSRHRPPRARRRGCSGQVPYGDAAVSASATISSRASWAQPAVHRRWWPAHAGCDPQQLAMAMLLSLLHFTAYCSRPAARTTTCRTPAATASAK